MTKVETLRVVRAAAAGAGAVTAIVAVRTAGIFWVLGVVAGCAVLTAAAVVALKRWSDGKVYAATPLQVRAEQVRYEVRIHAADEQARTVIPAAIERNEP